MPDYMILQELKKLKVWPSLAGFWPGDPGRHPFTAPPSCPQNANYESVQRTARSIAEQAHQLAYDPNYMSPFAQFACDNGLNVRGESLGGEPLLPGSLLEGWAHSRLGAPTWFEATTPPNKADPPRLHRSLIPSLF